jgi:hypothetical protein
MNHIESIFVFYKMDHCNFRKPLCAWMPCSRQKNSQHALPTWILA